MGYVRKRLNLSILGNLNFTPSVCDFCGLHAPEWVYAASRMSTGAYTRCWRWCACPDCAEKIEAQRFDQIILGIALTLSAVCPEVTPLMLRQAADEAFGDFHKYAIKEDV